MNFQKFGKQDIQKIFHGDFDAISNCNYKIPSFTAIGKQYSRMFLDCAKEGQEVEELINIFHSFISDEISNFKTGVYYQNMSYLEESYQAGYLLE